MKKLTLLRQSQLKVPLKPMKAANLRGNEKLLKIQRSQSKPTCYDVTIADNLKCLKTFNMCI